MTKIAEHVTMLYGEDSAPPTLARLSSLIAHYRARIPPPRATELTERDAFLITYGDQVRAPGEAPLRTLAEFCARYLGDLVTGVHLLPFFPYSSDDGFSVIDYRAVNPDLGTWDDLAQFRRHFRLTFDLVANHVSAQSAWFQGFLGDEPRYRDYFIVAPNGADVSRVVRPRTLPLLTPFATPRGTKNVWTTFSADQIDLNYHNPDVLLDMMDVLLGYVARGAELIRLDAIGFLWKEFGTTCLHLPQTHRVIQLMRGVLDEIAPHVVLITETNVPHADNVAYFGDGANEAQMVYNFALPPLTLHTFHTGNATALTRWANTLMLPSSHVTFFNFLASHDGIGLNPARGILSDAELDALVAHTQMHDGLVSHKNDPDGMTSPYELNINLFDALNDPHAGESRETQMQRFIAAQAIMLSLVGVPGIYFHSLFGSRGWQAGVSETGHPRAINREKLERAPLERELGDPGSRRSQVFARYARLLRARTAHPAFDPHGAMRVLDLGASVFAVQRTASNGATVIALYNVCNRVVGVRLDWTRAFGDKSARVIDLITRAEIGDGTLLSLQPYQALWLTQK
ncbi:MAG: sugar phosphorylase [Chloroflexi bacterium]|nr:sugar phosphorylase [Chloroflexota bacterium]